MKKIKQGKVIAFSILTLILAMFLTLAFIPSLKQVDKTTQQYESLYYETLNFKVTVILIGLFVVLGLFYLGKEILMYVKHKDEYDKKSSMINLTFISVFGVLSLVILLFVLVGFPKAHPSLFTDELNNSLKEIKNIDGLIVEAKNSGDTESVTKLEAQKAAIIAYIQLIDESNLQIRNILLIGAWLQISAFIVYVLYRFTNKMLAKKAKSKEVLA